MSSNKRKRTATLSDPSPNPKRPADSTTPATTAPIPPTIKTAIDSIMHLDPNVISALIERAASIRPIFADEVMKQHALVLQRHSSTAISFDSSASKVSDILEDHSNRTAPERNEDLICAEIEAILDDITDVATAVDKKTNIGVSWRTRQNALLAIAKIAHVVVELNNVLHSEVIQTSENYVWFVFKKKRLIEEAMLATLVAMKPGALKIFKEANGYAFVEDLEELMSKQTNFMWSMAPFAELQDVLDYLGGN